MARLNLLNLNFGPRTHEGAPARNISTELQLRRSVLACLLWESQFYEDGIEIAGRIAELVPKVAADKVAALAVEGREKMKLRHAPLLLVREMARHATHRKFVAETLARVIQRADELAEFVAIYWKDGRVPLSAQVKKGLAAAFPKFDEYALSKYDRGGPIKLRDVLFLAHAKPRDLAQAELWKRLIAGELTAPDTFALRDAIDASQRHNGTQLGHAVNELNRNHGYDRLVVITDEQAHDSVSAPKGKGYVINVASYKNGVGYGKWTHIDGWSESVVEYIRTLEQTQ
jgi:60 kDa SS-A/Ro ribonucleoprotein